MSEQSKVLQSIAHEIAIKEISDRLKSSGGLDKVKKKGGSASFCIASYFFLSAFSLFVLETRKACFMSLKENFNCENFI